MLAGETLTYRLVITNAGPSAASGVILTDTLPASITFNSATPGYSGPNPLVWSVGSLGVGESRAFTITTTVPFTATGVVTNTVTVGGNQPDPTPNNNQADAETTVQPAAIVYGHIFMDVNGNGSLDSGEPALPNVSVVITDSLGITRTVMTDASGNYTATVPAGITTADVVEASLPPGLGQTAGSDPSTIDALAGQSNDMGIDGYQAQGLLVVDVFYDGNGNGVHDAGEGLPGIPVVITPSVGAPFTVTTGADGMYTVTVPAGDTDVDVDDASLLAGVMQTVGQDPTTVSMPAGGTATDINGYQQPGSIGDLVWWDINGNGQPDPGEPGIPGVDLLLSGGREPYDDYRCWRLVHFHPSGGELLHGDGGSLGVRHAGRHALQLDADLHADAACGFGCRRSRHDHRLRVQHLA